MIITDPAIWKESLKKSHGDEFKNFLFNSKIESFGRFCDQVVFSNEKNEIKTVKSYIYDDLNDLSDIDVLYCIMPAIVLKNGKPETVNVIRCLKKERN